MKRLTYFFCTTLSVGALAFVATPGTSLGATCESRSPSSLFHYSSQAVCELEPLPPFFTMTLPDSGSWILSAFANWVAGGKTVTEPIALKERATEGTFVIKGEVSSVKTKISCTLATVLSGHFETEGTSTANIDFSECTVNEPASCTVGQPISLKTVKSELPTTAKIEFYPGEGEVFAELSYAGSSCSAKGNYPLTGGQACALDSKIETEETLHSITCATTGSNLKMACKGAMLETTAIDFELEGEKAYRTK